MISINDIIMMLEKVPKEMVIDYINRNRNLTDILNKYPSVLNMLKSEAKKVNQKLDEERIYKDLMREIKVKRADLYPVFIADPGKGWLKRQIREIGHLLGVI
jgi:hypothetical protein